MNELFPGAQFTAIAFDGTSILLADNTTKSISAITAGAVDTTKRIRRSVIESNTQVGVNIVAMEHDGDSLLLLDSGDRRSVLWAMTNGVRDPLKSILAESLVAGNPQIDPVGVGYGGDRIYILDRK